MRKLIVLAVVGLVAQLVDGSLGMGYGVTSSSLLVALAGLSPAAASASVHFSELGTNLASGVSHWRLKNVDWRVVGRIAVPGAVGAFLGAYVLSNLSTEAAAPVMSGILTVLGLYILVRFIVGIKPKITKAITVKFLAPLGLVAGFVDATGGGGWGPVATPALLADGRLGPRKVIGSIDTSEFAVSAAASLGFLFSLGAAGVNWYFALALLIGGLIAAPLAAYLVRLAPAHLLGVAVGGIILLTNARTILKSLDTPGEVRWPVYGVVVLITLAGLYVAALRAKKGASVQAQASDVQLDEQHDERAQQDVSA